jgi:acyl-CoA reductase-like NAD-dependent aldehyde dehydrogenase
MMTMGVLESRNPSNGELVGSVPVTAPEDVAACVVRGRQAQAVWGAASLAERREALLRACAAIAARKDELALLITREMGKPLSDARGEVGAVADSEDELLDMEAALAPETITERGVRSTLHRDPFGVVAAITPWNFPLMMPHWMVLPALMAGNAVVLKPSEETPLTGQAYVDALAAFLPPGAIQVVHGADVQGKALVASDVDLIAFTGSRDAGKHIMASASRGLKRVLLELGGKDPLIVLDGADIASAAAFAARNSFRNAGQVCVSTERIYVESSVAPAFLTALSEEARKLRVGDGQAPETRVGPMVSARQRDHVRAQIDDAVARGATLVLGGAEARGNFLPLTILSEVTHDMVIMRDETFGPVACVQQVRDAEEAVRLANDSPYALGAVVFGEEERATRVARRLTAGMIGINRGCGGVRGTPWVGARQSGYGFHSSREGHRQFAQVRVVTTAATST